MPLSDPHAGLRQKIRVLERHAPLVARGSETSEPWTLGAGEIDARLGAHGLDPAALHEVKPASAGAPAHAAALAFALRLAVRRLASLPAPRAVLWCWPQKAWLETGRLHGPGLARLGLEPSTLLIVETARASDALWVLEEGLKSGGVALAVGVLPELGLTPARRLALAAEAHATPLLVVTESASSPAPATATRWRIAPERSAPNSFATEVPGAPRARLALERCRGSPAPEALSWTVEWSDETHRFRVASDVADRAHAPPRDGPRRISSRAA